MEIKNDILHKPASLGTDGLAYFINQGQLLLKRTGWDGFLFGNLNRSATSQAKFA